MGSDKFEAKMEKALRKAEERKAMYEIKEIYKRYKPHIQTTKLIMAFIFINCTIVELYSMVIMLLLEDLSPLTTLIGAVVTESISFAIYCVKSYKETKSEAETVLDKYKFDSAMDSEADASEESIEIVDDDFLGDDDGFDDETEEDEIDELG